MALIKQKESLHLKLEKIDAALESLESGTEPVVRRGRKPGRKPGALKPGPKPGKVRRRGKRLKEPLLKILKASGAAGITVKEISAQLKVKPGNVFSWFYTTGKKIKGIKKVGEARYALVS
jgi:DNA invertase Pin-like site-specific DNA recombinase